MHKVFFFNFFWPGSLDTPFALLRNLDWNYFMIVCICVCMDKDSTCLIFPLCLIFKVKPMEFSYVLMLNSLMVVWCPWAAFTKFIMRHLSACVTVWEGSDGLRHLINPEHLLEDQCCSSSLFVCVWRSSLYRLRVWCPIKEASQTSDQSLRNRKWDSRDTQDIHHKTLVPFTWLQTIASLN